jgi:hypothetical protein
VQWVSVPLSDAQAGHALKPHIYAFDANQIDTTLYQQHCNGSSSGTSSSSSNSSSRQLQQQPDAMPPQRRWRALGQYGLPPEHMCDRLPVGEAAH